MTEDELRHKYLELQKRHKEVRSRLAEKILENRELSRRVAKQDMDLRSMQDLINLYEKRAKVKVIEGNYDFCDDKVAEALSKSIIDCNFSTRIRSAFRAADIEYMGDLVQYKPEQFLKFRNLGQKAVEEIESVVKSLGLKFGMKVVYDADLDTYLIKK